MSHYHIWTIGCQMNQAESAGLGAFLEERGYRAATRPEEAGLVVLNSCVVRRHAEDRVVNKLRALQDLKRQRPGMTIALTGCMVDGNVDQLQRRFPYVDYFLKPGELPGWLQDPAKSAAPLPGAPSPTTFVPIIQGCDNFCTYCIVPYRRGRERSRPPAEIVGQVREMVGWGVK
ncbi:MAG: radical SAM protein, partial [Chloroflexota bacterium]